MKKIIKLTSVEKKSIVDFLNGKLSFEKIAKVLGLSNKQSVYTQMTIIFKDLVESEKINIKDLLKKY
ncbi:MAG: hypothetical protein RLZZ546_2158 [Bacteroidota bacterium]